MPGAGPFLWAHPRSCGENHGSSVTRVRRPGSSPLTRGKRLQDCRPPRVGGLIPLMRGKHCLAFLCLSAFGLIPTHAGKTIFQASCLVALAVHPRSREENFDCEPAAPELVGSSPLMRGKLGAHDDALRDGGLIPTHAGKTGAQRL